MWLFSKKEKPEYKARSLLQWIALALATAVILAIVGLIINRDAAIWMYRHSPFYHALKYTLIQQDRNVFYIQKTDQQPYTMVFPTALSLETISELNGRSAKDQIKWVYDHGGYDKGTTNLLITLTAANEAVEITNIYAKTNKQPQAAGGTLLSQPPGGGSGPTEKFELDLDEAAPRAKDFPGNTITLKRDEPKTINVVAFASKNTVEWELFIDADIGGTKKTIKVDPVTGPYFRTAGYLKPADDSVKFGGGYQATYLFQYEPNTSAMRVTPCGELCSR